MVACLLNLILINIIVGPVKREVWAKIPSGHYSNMVF